MPRFFSRKIHTQSILQKMPDDLWFSIIPFLDPQEFSRLSLAHRQASKIFFRDDADCERFFFIQTLINELEAQCRIEAKALTNKMISTAIRKTSIKNWLFGICPLVPASTIIPSLAVMWKQASNISSNYIETVLAPTCSLQWSHFSTWFMSDDSCVSLFNCTASLCSTAIDYKKAEGSYMASLIILGTVSGGVALIGAGWLIQDRCKHYSVEHVTPTLPSDLKTYLLSNVVSLDVQLRVASVLNDSLNSVGSQTIEKIVHDLKLTASAIKPGLVPFPQKITSRIEHLRQPVRNHLFNDETVRIDIEPDSNEEKKAFLS